MSNLQIVAVALASAYSLLSEVNSQHGTGTIETVAVDVKGTDLDNGVVKGHVTRSTGDKRTFSLKATKKGKVTVRFLDKRTTVSAS